MASLKDVAAFTGLSIRTVSRVMNSGPNVSPQTRTRILDAAKRLDYRPNLAARALKSGKSHEIVAVIAPHLKNELHIVEVAAFEQAVREAGYTLSLLVGPYETNGSIASAQVLELILERRPAGVAFFPECCMPLQRSVALAENKDIPCVALDSNEGYVDTVTMDRPQGVYEAVKYLASKGRRRIAYVGYLAETHGPQAPPWNAVFGGQTRLNGYERAIGESGLEPVILPVSPEFDSYEGGQQGARMLLSASVRPDAVQVYSDQMAAGLLAGLHECGLRIPEDVAVVGFGDIEVASLLWPRLTTVAQPVRPLARAAAEILLSKINGTTAPEGSWSRCIPTRLVVRDSA